MWFEATFQRRDVHLPPFVFWGTLAPHASLAPSVPSLAMNAWLALLSPLIPLTFSAAFISFSILSISQRSFDPSAISLLLTRCSFQAARLVPPSRSNSTGREQARATFHGHVLGKKGSDKVRVELRNGPGGDSRQPFFLPSPTPSESRPH